jgi:hypothetical protein
VITEAIVAVIIGVVVEALTIVEVITEAIVAVIIGVVVEALTIVERGRGIEKGRGITEAIVEVIIEVESNRISNVTELITQLIFLFPVKSSLSQRVNLILSDYLLYLLTKN